VTRVPRAGDLVAALLLARLHEQPGNLRAAVAAVMAAVQAVMRATVAAAGDAAHAAERTPEVRIPHSRPPLLLMPRFYLTAGAL